MITLFFTLLSTASVANAKGVSVRLTGQTLFETEPKNVVTTTFKVVSTSDEEQEFIAQVRLPKGWKNLSNAFPFTLGPNAMKIELVSFFVPQHVLAGKYEISYMVSSRKHMGVSDLKTIHVMVLPVSKLQVRLLESPDHVIAGEDYLATFMVINESNVDNALHVKIESSTNLPYQVDNEIFSLTPGASELVKVVVSTDAALRQKFRHHISFTASEGESPGARAEAYVDVIPRVRAVKDRYHRIPSKVTLRQITVRNGEDATAIQAEFSGEGSLDEDGEKNLQFLFQGPDTQEKSSYGERDAYSVKYWTKNSDLLLGDHSYSLSPLTENYLYGRGVGGNLTYKNFGVGAYHMKSLWADPDVEETALNLSYRFNDKNRIRLNFLQKNDDEIMSMESGFHLGEKTNLELELAMGKNDDQYDHAFWLSFHGFHPWLSYYLKYFYATPDYPGYYQDKEFISANLTIPATENLSFNLTLQQEKDNLDLNTDLDSASLERYGQLGVDYRFRGNTHLSLNSHIRTREDRLSDPDFKDQEKTLRAGLGHNFEKLSLNVSAEMGVKEDQLEHESFDLYRYTGSLYYRASPNQTYSAYLRYGDEEFANENDKRSINAGVNGSFRFSQKTRLDLDVQTYRYLESDSGNRDIFEISASHGLFKNHTISAKARYTAYRDSAEEDNETFVFAEYTIPVGLPVSAKKGMGSIRGHLSDAESGQAISNTILRLNGETAVTNKKGGFVFPSLMAGNHYLSVDQAGIGLDKITTQKLPLKVKVEGGKEVSVKISVTRSALVSGQIMGYRFADTGNMFSGNEGKELSEGTGMANILVEMKSAL